MTNILLIFQRLHEKWPFRISESSERWKRQTLEFLTTRNQNNENSEKAELEMKAIFIGWKLATTTFFDIRARVGPLDVYLQNLKSLRSLHLRQKVLKPLKSAVFLRDSQKVLLRCLRKMEGAEKNTTQNFSLFLPFGAILDKNCFVKSATHFWFRKQEVKKALTVFKIEGLQSTVNGLC